MRTLTVNQFRNYCEQRKPKTIIYDSSNDRTWFNTYTIPDIRQCLRFHAVIVSLCPNTICLKSECGTICFAGVSKVRINDSALYDIVRIVCKDGDREFTIIFDY